MEVNDIRRFNRFYTRVLGVFDESVFELDYSLLEMRTLGEIGRNKGITGNYLCKYLKIDKGYLSRILSKLINNQLIYKEKNEDDNRVYHLFLTDDGEELNKYVEIESDRKVVDLLKPLKNSEIQELKRSMVSIESILNKVVTNELEER
ncbi:MarR family winged helix-turn-helix transcriptional regulator [Mammaliicoccus sp. Dog046]|uniref:MarR family winged helix-turn-helix transcriptional regulator n=1 Tax=Mammaliicoccus sp. Dog046 TaxID=3034233 RepID=UPI002B256F88|nr:MarR family winged helix-turn-helix transcriptional regulator [Mammaliicoccus sp. Dog046]WQK84752.1 MarR family winged helix-turn-helix transcriptional regulator [Mammaliicoccus sp. Dog046]